MPRRHPTIVPPTIVALALAAVASGALAGCGNGCKSSAEPALQVTVLDGPGGAALCGVTVTARDGAFSEILAEYPGPPCVYLGPPERPGVYDVEATFEGRTSTLLDVPAAVNGCHVDRTDVTIVLPALAQFEGASEASGRLTSAESSHGQPGSYATVRTPNARAPSDDPA